VTVDLELNKSVVRSFVAAWNERGFDRFDELMADDALLSVSGVSYSCNPKSTRAIATEWTTAFPDWTFDLLTLVAEGDCVVAHMPYQGTFRQPLFGTPPTGRFARVDEVVIFRIEQGLVAEAWEVYDEAGMWRQLGTTPLG
jgi:steroid delta-isomerase-like uncharacterized protein